MKRIPATACLAAAVLLLALCAHAGRREGAAQEEERGGAESWTPPDFCRNKDCPEFGVIETRDDVELRRYKRAHWISTNVSNAKWSDAYQEGYRRLQKYISGDNVNSTKLPQTNPSFTLLYVADPKAHTLQSTFTIEYFVPFELQERPPEPTAEDLGITPVEEQDVWVLSFGGFATEDVVVQRGFEFIDNLTGDGVQLHSEFIGLALYDQPARLINRHNELWLWAKGKPSAAAKVLDNDVIARGRLEAQQAAERIKQTFEELWSRAGKGGEEQHTVAAYDEATAGGERRDAEEVVKALEELFDASLP